MSKEFNLGQKVELVDHCSDEPITTGTIIGTANIVKNGVFVLLYVVNLDPYSQGYLLRDDGMKAGYVSAVIVHPDNILRIL